MIEGNFDGFTEDNETILGWAKDEHKRINVWLIRCDDKKELSISASKYRVDKAASGEYPYCGFEIHIDSFDDFFIKENCFYKIAFDKGGNHLLPGYKQPFTIPKVLNCKDKIDEYFQYEYNDTIPDLMKKKISILRKYGGFYRNWYSKKYLKKEATAYEPELSIISSGKSLTREINPFNNYLPDQFFNADKDDYIKLRDEEESLNLDSFDFIYKKIFNNKNTLVPEDLPPVFRQKLINELVEKNYKISVIVPCWNRSKTIEKSLDSALSQTFEPNEVIVCDDGSTDDSIKKIKKSFPSSIASNKLKIIQSNHLGVSNARNLALKTSNGDFLAYLDSDNTWHPDHLLFLSYFINFKEGFDLIYSTRKLFGSRVNGKISKINLFDYRKLLIGNFIDLNCILHTRKLYEKLGGFDLILKRLVDWDLMLKYTNPKIKTKVTSLNIATVNYWRNKKYFLNISNNEDWEASRDIIDRKYNNL